MTKQLPLPGMPRNPIYPVNDEYRYEVWPKDDRWGWRVACVFYGTDGTMLGASSIFRYATEAEAHLAARGMAMQARTPRTKKSD